MYELWLDLVSWRKEAKWRNPSTTSTKRSLNWYGFFGCSNCGAVVWENALILRRCMLSYLVAECLEDSSSLLLDGLAKGKCLWTNMACAYQEVKADKSYLWEKQGITELFNFSVSLKSFYSYFYFENYINIVHLEYAKYFPTAPISQLQSK